MNSYKQTAEYAFDVLEHFYNIHHNQILSLGKDNIFILIPITFRDIKIEEYSGSRILFCLKEVK